MGFIYCITSPSGKKYVGQTIGSVEKRIKVHKKVDTKDRGCRALGNAGRKYGWENLKVETLLEINNEFLDEYEIKCIDMYNCLVPNGYNITAGGGGTAGFRHSEESKRKMSKRFKQDYADGTRTIRRGFVGPNKGKHMSEAAKKKLSETRKRKFAEGKYEKSIRKGSTLTDKQREALAKGRSKRSGSVSFCKWLKGPKRWKAKGPKSGGRGWGIHSRPSSEGPE